METVHPPTRFLKSGWRNVYATDMLSEDRIMPRKCFQNAECGRPRPQQRPPKQSYLRFYSQHSLRRLLRPRTGALRNRSNSILKTRPNGYRADTDPVGSEV